MGLEGHRLIGGNIIEGLDQECAQDCLQSSLTFAEGPVKLHL